MEELIAETALAVSKEMEMEERSSESVRARKLDGSKADGEDR